LDRWIVIHWFELITLVLLCLNLWFVFEVLKVLRAVKDCLMLLAGWLDKTRSESKREGRAGIDARDRP
jgi:hypothetical protein